MSKGASIELTAPGDKLLKERRRKYAANMRKAWEAEKAAREAVRKTTARNRDSRNFSLINTEILEVIFNIHYKLKLLIEQYNKIIDFIDTKGEIHIDILLNIFNHFIYISPNDYNKLNSLFQSKININYNDFLLQWNKNININFYDEIVKINVEILKLKDEYKTFEIFFDKKTEIDIPILLNLLDHLTEKNEYTHLKSFLRSSQENKIKYETFLEVVGKSYGGRFKKRKLITLKRKRKH
jgi:hypothetical protein